MPSTYVTMLYTVLLLLTGLDVRSKPLSKTFKESSKHPNNLEDNINLDEKVLTWNRNTKDTKGTKDNDISKTNVMGFMQKDSERSLIQQNSHPEVKIRDFKYGFKASSKAKGNVAHTTKKRLVSRPTSTPYYSQNPSSLRIKPTNVLSKNNSDSDKKQFENPDFFTENYFNEIGNKNNDIGLSNFEDQTHEHNNLHEEDSDGIQMKSLKGYGQQGAMSVTFKTNNNHTSEHYKSKSKKNANQSNMETISRQTKMATSAVKIYVVPFSSLSISPAPSLGAKIASVDKKVELQTFGSSILQGHMPLYSHSSRFSDMKNRSPKQTKGTSRWEDSLLSSYQTHNSSFSSNTKYYTNIGDNVKETILETLQGTDSSTKHLEINHKQQAVQKVKFSDKNANFQGSIVIGDEQSLQTTTEYKIESSSNTNNEYQILWDNMDNNLDDASTAPISEISPISIRATTGFDSVGQSEFGFHSTIKLLPSESSTMLLDFVKTPFLQPVLLKDNNIVTSSPVMLSMSPTEVRVRPSQTKHLALPPLQTTLTSLIDRKSDTILNLESEVSDKLKTSNGLKQRADGHFSPEMDFRNMEEYQNDVISDEMDILDSSTNQLSPSNDASFVRYIGAQDKVHLEISKDNTYMNSIQYTPTVNVSNISSLDAKSLRLLISANDVFTSSYHITQINDGRAQGNSKTSIQNRLNDMVISSDGSSSSLRNSVNPSSSYSTMSDIDMLYIQHEAYSKGLTSLTSLTETPKTLLYNTDLFPIQSSDYSGLINTGFYPLSSATQFFPSNFKSYGLATGIPYAKDQTSRLAKSQRLGSTKDKTSMILDTITEDTVVQTTKTLHTTTSTESTSSSTTTTTTSSSSTTTRTTTATTTTTEQLKVPWELQALCKYLCKQRSIPIPPTCGCTLASWHK